MKTIISRLRGLFTKETLPERIIDAFIYGIMTGIFYYYQLIGIDKFSSFFEISIVSATLGGFLFIGGFVQNRKSVIKKYVSKSGKEFLTSAVCFAILGVTVPILANVNRQTDAFFYWPLYIVSAVFLLIAGISFANAVAKVLVYLWIRRND